MSKTDITSHLALRFSGFDVGTVRPSVIVSFWWASIGVLPGEAYKFRFFHHSEAANCGKEAPKY